MIKIVSNVIDETAVLEFVKSDQAGAVVFFAGTTREFTGDKQTTSLCYDAYHDMAEKELQRLARDAADKWPLETYAIVHRVGEVPIGETSVVVAVSSTHRVDAFEAAIWIMDSLKQEVPIWKQEHWADGTHEWIHPNDQTELNNKTG